MARGDLTDEQWSVLEPLLPRGTKAGRPHVWPRRQLVDGIRFRVRTGVPWRDVPVEYGPWGRIHDLFRRWQRAGTWHRGLTQLQSLADAKSAITWELSVDSTVCRAHQHAAGARKRGDLQKEPPGGVRTNTNASLSSRYGSRGAAKSVGSGRSWAYPARNARYPLHRQDHAPRPLRVSPSPRRRQTWPSNSTGPGVNHPGGKRLARARASSRCASSRKAPGGLATRAGSASTTARPRYRRCGQLGVFARPGTPDRARHVGQLAVLNGFRVLLASGSLSRVDDAAPWVDAPVLAHPGRPQHLIVLFTENLACLGPVGDGVCACGVDGLLTVGLPIGFGRATCGKCGREQGDRGDGGAGPHNSPRIV
ncbi:IS5 family transposase [Streptomyces sp. NBC_00178]|nr:IS5 family transposase [Streptomyces sp. NBC_00178]